ncbi:hypothetical protein ACFQ48_14715 [Hymenobacter caeli]|uniref:Uncharacterized protein n=1 Tax=Hymenobacter caeli TaxID=2735894 RepID=A0ABX2FSK7_9BACT|nr:hypothetical protein [Hymenobacter caeli]NRT20175.1 hypothetical protein [Hymenobacter caeli]
MDTQNNNLSSAPDQEARAKEAHLNPNDPAKDAEAGTPGYGDFGKPTDANAPKGRSGSNDNPDEFSAIRDEAKAQDHPDNREDQPGHVMQNQATELVREVQASGAEAEELDAAWAKDDPRYAGGGTHNMRTAGADPNQANRNIAAADQAASK